MENQTIESLLAEIKEQQEQFATNSEKARKGVKAAATRARKNTLVLTKLYKNYRALSLGKE